MARYEISKYGVDEKEIENLANDYIKYGNAEVELDELIDDLSVQPYFAKQYGEIDYMEDEDERLDAEEDIDADVKATAEAVLAKIKDLSRSRRGRMHREGRRPMRRRMNEATAVVNPRIASKFIGKIEDLSRELSKYIGGDEWNSNVISRAVKSLNAAIDHLEDVE